MDPMLPQDTRIADFILELDWDSLPPEVQLKVKLCLLNTLGAGLAGMLTPAGCIAAETASGLWRGGDATILLHPQRTQAPGAAFANACAASALNLDDEFIQSVDHPGAQLVPAVLAVSEAAGASGREMLAALVAGGEIAFRIARCWHADHEFEQSSGSWGAVACAAAAARLLHLNRDEVFHALGIADYHAANAPRLRSMHQPAMDQQAMGWGAMNGVAAAQLAGRGFTGIPSLLDQDQYYPWVWNIGLQFEFTEHLVVKSWAACDSAVSACQAALSLVQERQIAVDQIQTIRVLTFAQALLLSQDLPTTTEEAQNNLRWLAACLLLDGEIGPDQVLAPRFSDPRVQRLFEKVELVLDPQVDSLAQRSREKHAFMPGAVAITLEDGRSFASDICEFSVGLLEQLPVERKFRRLAGYVLAPETVEDLISLVNRFEQLESVGELTRLLGHKAVSGGLANGLAGGLARGWE